MLISPVIYMKHRASLAESYAILWTRAADTPDIIVLFQSGTPPPLPHAHPSL